MALLEDDLVSNFLFDTDENDTHSSYEQAKVEASIRDIYQRYCKPLIQDAGQELHGEQRPVKKRLDDLKLFRAKHAGYLLAGLKDLSSSLEYLDASRTWLCYWMIHALNLLGQDIDEALKSQIAGFLSSCQSPKGGFGGGPGFFPHVASTYGAVMALCSLGTEEAYQVIDRQKLEEFYRSIVDPVTGAVHVEVGGEADVRGAYCALAVIRLLNLDVGNAYDPVALWLSRCQTYEGGFGGCPGMEAHGGYSYCAFTALVMMGKEKLADVDALARWASRRQLRFEGGFQGRTNKLVDACYSFWVGGLFPLIEMVLANDGRPHKELLCSRKALQSYVLVCCQSGKGGLFDKPGKGRDYYHTCYALSGLSVMQHFPWIEGDEAEEERRVLGQLANTLEATHPLFNIRLDRAAAALAHFKRPGTMR